MTPENKEKIRLNLIDYITGTVDEWLRIAHFDQTPEDRDGIQYRIGWEHPADGAMIASLTETQYGDPIARFGVQIVVDALPDLSPIGPENDLGIYGIDEQVSEEPVWVETTMTNCLINDRIRLRSRDGAYEETTVLRSNHGIWHANNAHWQPTRWDHVELRMELEAVPGFKQYPAAASIEILCTPERLAVLRIQEGFPGSAVTSSHVD